MPGPKYDLPMGDLLQQEGLTIVGIDSVKGTPIVRDQDGQEYDFPVDDLLKRDGIKKEEVNIEYNTPETALEVSPLTQNQRLMNSFGDAKTIEKNLSQQFEEVRHSDKGVLVKNKGVWQQVDPQFFQNSDPVAVTKALLKSAYKITEIGHADNSTTQQIFNELKEGKLGKASLTYLKNTSGLPEYLDAIKAVGSNAVGMVKDVYKGVQKEGALKELQGDIVDATSDINRMVLETAGSAIGQRFGGKPGNIAGTGVGALVAGLSNNWLGKAYGTYNLPPEEEAKGLALDMVLSMGGQALAMGAQPSVEYFKKGIKDFSETANPVVKDIMATVLGTTSRSNPNAIRHGMDNADRVIKPYIGRMDVGAVQDMATQKYTKATETLLDEAQPALSAEYGKNLADVVEKAGSRLGKWDADEHVTQIARHMESMGIGRLVKKESTPRALEENLVDALGQQVKNVGESSSKWVFVPFSPEEQAELATRGPIKYPDSQMMPFMKEVEGIINDYAVRGKVDARAGVRFASDLNKQLNSLLRDELGGKWGSAQKLIAHVGNAVDSGISDIFHRVGLSSEWGKVNTEYSLKKDAVNWALAQVKSNSNNAIENIVGQLTTQGKNVRTKSYTKQIVDLLGAKGKALESEMLDNFAVKEFAPIMKMGLFQAATAGAATSKLLAGGTIPGLAIPLATMLSPKGVGLDILAMRKLNATMKGMTRGTLNTLINNPQAVQAFLRPVIEATGEKELLQNQLMQQVLGGQNGQQ